MALFSALNLGALWPSLWAERMVCACVCVYLGVSRQAPFCSPRNFVLSGFSRVRDYTGQRVEAGGTGKGLGVEMGGRHLRACRLRPAPGSHQGLEEGPRLTPGSDGRSLRARHEPAWSLDRGGVCVYVCV